MLAGVQLAGCVSRHCGARLNRFQADTVAASVHTIPASHHSVNQATDWARTALETPAAVPCFSSKGSTGRRSGRPGGWCAAGPAGRQKHADCAGEWSAGVRSQHMKLHAPVLLMITSAASAPLGFCPTPVPVSGAARLGRGGVQVWPANPQLTDSLPAACSGPRREAGALLSSAVSWAHARGTDWGFWSAMVHTPAPAAESTCSAPGAGQSMTLARCHAFH